MKKAPVQPVVDETVESEISLTLTHGGRKWNLVVHEMTLPLAMKVERVRTELKKRKYDDMDVEVIAVNIYPQLAGCCTGEVPSLEEFIVMPVLQSGAWYDAVEKINPGYLVAATTDAATAKAELEKKGQ